jgi:hypothetical protein
MAKCNFCKVGKLNSLYSQLETRSGTAKRNVSECSVCRMVIPEPVEELVPEKELISSMYQAIAEKKAVYEGRI